MSGRIDGFFDLAREVAARRGCDPLLMLAGGRARTPAAVAAREELIARAMRAGFDSALAMAALGLASERRFFEAAERGLIAMDGRAAAQGGGQ